MGIEKPMDQRGWSECPTCGGCPHQIGYPTSSCPTCVAHFADVDAAHERGVAVGHTCCGDCDPGGIRLGGWTEGKAAGVREERERWTEVLTAGVELAGCGGKIPNHVFNRFRDSIEAVALRAGPASAVPHIDGYEGCVTALALTAQERRQDILAWDAEVRAHRAEDV